MTLKGKPKSCKHGCNTTIAWYLDDATGEKFFAEIGQNGQVGKRHKCPNWSPEKTTLAAADATKTSSSPPGQEGSIRNVLNFEDREKLKLAAANLEILIYAFMIKDSLLL